MGGEKEYTLAPRVPRPDQIVDCPLCGKSPARLWRRENEWSVVRCRGCALLRTWPPPDAATLRALYASGNYYDARSMGASSEAAWVGRAGEIVGSLPRRPSTVLDFGAGEGHLVHALRARGLRAEGVEPFPAGREAARERYGLELLEALPADRRFDLVTLVHALEHVPEPVSTLTRLREVLEPQGLVFVEVPNAASVDMHRAVRRREILDLPVHLFHFSPETLVRVIERAGLQVIELRLSNPDALEWLLARRQPPAAVTAPQPPSAAAAPVVHHPSVLRRAWRRFLPWLRSRLPGSKIQAVAARAG
jgi:SAM-dependent methyltransferase